MIRTSLAAGMTALALTFGAGVVQAAPVPAPVSVAQENTVDDHDDSDKTGLWGLLGLLGLLGLAGLRRKDNRPAGGPVNQATPPAGGPGTLPLQP